jgi:repressor LexA
MFYDRFRQLCENKGVSCNKAALEIGLSNATPTKWRKTGATPTGDTLDRIAKYFGVSTDYLLGKETEKAPAGDGKRSVSDDDIKFALFGGDGEITDAMYDEVRNFAAYVKQREADKRKG